MSASLHRMTRQEHEAAVLLAHGRYSSAIAALDEHDARRARLATDLHSAEAELRALARRVPR